MWSPPAAIDEVKDEFGGEVHLFSQGQQEGDVPSTTILDQAIHKTSTSSPPRDTTTKFSGKLISSSIVSCHKVQWLSCHKVQWLSCHKVQW